MFLVNVCVCVSVSVCVCVCVCILDISWYPILVFVCSTYLCMKCDDIQKNMCLVSWTISLIAQICFFMSRDMDTFIQIHRWQSCQALKISRWHYCRVLWSKKFVKAWHSYADFTYRLWVWFRMFECLWYFVCVFLVQLFVLYICVWVVWLY